MTATTMTPGADGSGDEAPAAAIFQLGYASAATTPFDSNELFELLSKARTNNQALGVTGMLLYHEGSFIQILEGDQETVEALYAKISQDPRHSNALLLFRRTVEERSFGDWTMGFYLVDTSVASSLPGLNRFLQSGAAGLSSDDGEQIRSVLLGFRSGKWRRAVDA